MSKKKETDSVKELGIGNKLFRIFSLTIILPALISIYLVINHNLPEKYSKYQFMVILFFEVMIICLGIYLSSKMVSSIIKTMSAIKEVAEGNVSKRLTESAREEISGLAINFNKITSRLENTVKNLEASKEQMRKMLFKIGGIISSPVEIDRVMQIFLSTTIQVLEGEKGFVFMQDNEKESLKLLVNVNATDEDLKYYENCKKEGIIEKVISGKRSVRISNNDIAGKNEGLSPIDKSSTSINAPIILGGRVLGVISLVDKKNSDGFLEDEMFLLENLSSQIAMAFENSRLHKNAEKSYFETVVALATAVDSRDEYTIGHSKQVSRYAVEIAKNIGLAQKEIDIIRDASLLHDIGKIGMPDEILRNTDELTKDEKDLVWKHPVTGENILKPVESLSKLCPIVRHHHERFDGSGYPDGLHGNNIPFFARIVMLADSYDAMRSDRSYQKGKSAQEAIAEIKKCSGSQFDPLCVKAFVEYLENSSER